MRVKKSVLIAGTAAIFVAGGFSCARAADPATFPTLQELDQESQALYRQVSGSFVRVSVTQSAVAALDPALQTEYASWRASVPAPMGGGGRGRGRGGGPGLGAPGPNGTQAGGGNFGIGPPGGSGPGGVPGQGPGGGFGGPGRGGYGGIANGGNSVRTFLQEKLASTSNLQPQTDDTRAQADHIRTLLLHLELVRDNVQGDEAALVLDDKGYLLLLAGLLREAHGDPLIVTLPDGTTAQAKFVGSNLYGSYTVLRLDNPHGLKPARLSAQAVMPGQLLMNVPAGAGAMSLSWGAAKSLSGGERFGAPGDDRGGAFVFNVQGEMVSAAPGGWAERALKTADLEREIDYIKTGNGGKGADIEPRELGITFGPIDPAEPAAVSKALAGRPAVQVITVTAGSPAEKAGIKAGDVMLSIDGKPMSELVLPNRKQQSPELLSLRASLVTRTSAVPIGVIQADGSEKTLDMKLN